MKLLRMGLWVVIGVLLVLSCSQKPSAEAGFESLLNGKDLSGWWAKDGQIESWQFADGMLSCIAEGGGWLSTEQEYANFILRLEWRVPKDGNSGVGLRFPKEGNPAHDGMEIQILDDSAEIHKDILDVQHTGSIYYQVAAKPGATRPAGEWNQYEITCAGPLVRVKLNGVQITEANVDDYPMANGEYLPLKDRPRKGFIGLQSHGSQVDFRNVEIKVLP